MPAEPGAFFRHVRVPVEMAKRYRVAALGARGGSTRISLWQHGAFLDEDASPGGDAYIAWDSFSDGTATVGIAATGDVRLVFYAHAVGHLPLPLDRGEHGAPLDARLASADLQLRRLAYAPLLEPIVGEDRIETSFQVEAGACYAFAGRDDTRPGVQRLELDLPGADNTLYLEQKRKGGVRADFVCADLGGRADLRGSSRGDRLVALVYRRHAPPPMCGGEPCRGTFELGDGFVFRTEGYEALFRGNVFRYRDREKAFTLPAGRCAAFAAAWDDEPGYRLRVETTTDPRHNRRDRWERRYDDPRWIHLCAEQQPMTLRAYTVDVDIKEDFDPVEPALHSFAVVVPRHEPVDGFYLDEKTSPSRSPAPLPPPPVPPRGLILE